MVLFNVVEPLPVFTKQPGNPSYVDEGDNITLRWTYNIDGTLREGQFSLLPSTIIAVKDGSGLTVVPGTGYENRIVMIVSESETNITLVAVNRSDTGTYSYMIKNNVFQFQDSTVAISVRIRCK